MDKSQLRCVSMRQMLRLKMHFQNQKDIFEFLDNVFSLFKVELAITKN